MAPKRARVSTRVAKANKQIGQKDWLTLEELSVLYRFSYHTIRRAIQRGELNGNNGLAKVGRLYRIHRPTFERIYMGFNPFNKRGDDGSRN